MLLIIRIAGMVETPKKVNESLFRLRLRRKYASILLKPTNENLKMLRVLRDYIAYGNIDKETLHLLIKNRSILKDKSKKINVENIIEQIEKKGPKSWDIKQFFRLHPPRGGIESKKHSGVGKGVLGDNKNKINDLIRRML